MPPTSDPGAPPLVSIVVPVHNNEGTLATLCAEIDAAITPTGRAYEVILVDDASTDGTWPVIVGLSEADARVRGVRLAHNVGGGTGRAAGCAAALGTYICTIDADLDYRPTDLIGVIELLEAGNEVVHGVRLDDRGRPLGRKIGSRLLRRMVARTWSFVPRDLGSGLQGWTRELVTLSLPYCSTHRDLMWAIPLFAPARSFAEVEVSHRIDSRSSYALPRQVARILMMTLVVWRDLPAALISLGLLTSGLAGVGGAAATVWWALDGPAWPAAVALATIGWIGLPMALGGVVLARLDRLTAASTPPWVVRSTTP